MDVVKINLLYPEALQAALNALSAILRGGVDPDTTLSVLLEAELGGEEDVGAAFGVEFEPFPDDVLVITVCIGSVPIGAPELPGSIENLEAFLVGASK